MATDGSNPDSSTPSEEEQQLNDALKRLKLLHIKARLLRDTVEKMLEPLHTKQRNPEALFNAFVKAVQDAQFDVNEFTELMMDETTKQVFAMAQKSEDENPVGIRPWRHSEYPNWFDMDKDD